MKHNISHEGPIKELVYYFASNIGKEFSYTNISEYLGLGSPNTVSKYCGYLEDCYLCFFLTRYSHSLSKQMQSNKKCYMIDPAIIRVIGFRSSEDRGRLLENIVFLHLKMMGKEIFFHKEQKECDFITRKGNRVVEAIQVATHLSNPKVRKREFDGLLDALNTYHLKRGIILTENEEEILDIEGFKIEILPIWKWLLAE